MAMASSMLREAMVISRYWPPMSMLKSSGRRIPASLSCMSPATLPRSMPVRFAVTRATRCWSMRRISLGPSSSCTRATAPSWIGPLSWVREAAWVPDRNADSSPSSFPPVRSLCPAFPRSPAFTAMAFNWAICLRSSSLARTRMSILRSPAENRVATLPRTLFRDRVRGLPDVHAEGRHPVAVENDHGFGVARLHQGPHVPQAFQVVEDVDHLSADAAEVLEVVSPDLDLQRSLEAEQRRPDEFDPGVRYIGQALPQTVHDGIAASCPNGFRVEHDPDAGHVLALFIHERSTGLRRAHHDVDLPDIRILPDQGLDHRRGFVRFLQRRAGGQDEVHPRTRPAPFPGSVRYRGGE